MIPQRIILAFMGFFGLAIAFAVRSCFPMAITEMIIPIDSMEKRNTSTYCPATLTSTENSTNDSVFIQSTGTKYNWSQAQQGWILSSYYAGYSVGHIPGALLTHKFSAKWMLALSILIPCICNAATPFVLTYGMLKKKN